MTPPRQKAQLMLAPPTWPDQPKRVDGAEHITFMMSFRLQTAVDHGHYIYLQFTVADRDTGQPIELNFSLSIDPETWKHRPEERIRIAIREALMHEVDESIRVGGVRVFDPHLDPRLIREQLGDEG